MPGPCTTRCFAGTACCRGSIPDTQPGVSRVLQAFFNKSLLQVLSHIITPYAATEAADEEEELLASARQAISTAPLGQVGGRPRGLRGVSAPGPLPKRLPKYVENKHVVQMRVPKPYVEREYRVCRMALRRLSL